VSGPLTVMTGASISWLIILNTVTVVIACFKRPSSCIVFGRASLHFFAASVLLKIQFSSYIVSHSNLLLNAIYVWLFL